MLVTACVYTFGFIYLFYKDVDVENVLLPNIITPNGDDINDKFLINELFQSCTEYKIEFINRWGELVYTMTSNDNAFEGKDQNNSELTPGVYFYKLTSPVVEKHGFLHIVRD
jgi:gliding motility-associated-like protein